MNSKDLRFLQLFESLVNKDYMSNPDILKSSLKQFITLDYKLALDVWEYILIKHDSFLGESRAAEDLLCDFLFEFFYSKGASKCLKAVQDNAVIRKAIYQYSAKAISDARQTLFCDALMMGKSALYEDIIRSLVKSERLSFGAFMKKSFDKILVELLKKNPSRVEMNKKLKDSLTSAISKIRTDEKSMLEQRLREII